jgi:hypothetical protein
MKPSPSTPDQLLADIAEVEVMLDSLLPLPSVPQDMTVKDYDLYIKLAQVFNPMANQLRPRLYVDPATGAIEEHP